MQQHVQNVEVRMILSLMVHLDANVLMASLMILMIIVLIVWMDARYVLMLKLVQLVGIQRTSDLKEMDVNVRIVSMNKIRIV